MLWLTAAKGVEITIGLRFWQNASSTRARMSEKGGAR